MQKEYKNTLEKENAFKDCSVSIHVAPFGNTASQKEQWKSRAAELGVLQLHSKTHYNIPVFISSCMAKWTQGQPNREEKGLT